MTTECTACNGEGQTGRPPFNDQCSTCRGTGYVDEQSRPVSGGAAPTIDSVPSCGQENDFRRATPRAAAAGTWTADEFWQYVGGLAGEWEAGEMRRMMNERGLALATPPPAAVGRDETEDDEGIDFALMQLCAFLGVDPQAVTWDAATETRDGDVRAVIGNILRAKYGEDFDPKLTPQDGRTSAIEECAKIADRAAKRCVREGIVGEAACQFVAQQIRAIGAA